MIRSARPRLVDIDENISIIFDRVEGKNFDQFAADLDLRYITLHALMIIAEAVRNLPPDLTAGHPDIAWTKIVGLGTKIKHEYHRVDLFIIWSAITEQLPLLQPIIKKMLQNQLESASEACC